MPFQATSGTGRAQELLPAPLSRKSLDKHLLQLNLQRSEGRKDITQGHPSATGKIFRIYKDGTIKSCGNATASPHEIHLRTLRWGWGIHAGNSTPEEHPGCLGAFFSRKAGQEDEATKEQVQLPLVVMLPGSPCLSFPSCPGGNTPSFARCLGCEEEKCAHSLGSYF